MCLCYAFFFFKQKTAYEMRISDWSSDVCSSDLKAVRLQIVRRVDQLIHLTDRLVTGVRHLGLAKPEPFCCRCARQERERLRYGEAEIDRKQRFKLARRCR